MCLESSSDWDVGYCIYVCTWLLDSLGIVMVDYLLVEKVLFLLVLDIVVVSICSNDKSNSSNWAILGFRILRTAWLKGFELTFRIL